MSRNRVFFASFVIFLIFLVIVFFLLFNGSGAPSVRDNATPTPGSRETNERGIDSQINDAASPFIQSLRVREFTSSQITIESTLAQNDLYSGYVFSYLSDGLTIYGRMNVPNTDEPQDGFPVILLNHGYFNQATFSSGDGTQTMADILARNGYLTLASDYRGFGKSENDGENSHGHDPDYAIDVLNLLASVNSLEYADDQAIGMWGHSMGGEVSIRVVEATDRVRAIVLWAPTSTNQSINSAFYGGGRTSKEAGEAHNDTDLSYISTPISLHQGLEDTEVDPEWSKELHADLERLDKPIEYFEYPDQDHNFRNLGWDTISGRTIDFFDRHLK